MAVAYVSFFESGRAIVSQKNKPILVFNVAPGLSSEISAQGFDVDEVQALINQAAEKHNGISWDLIPPGIPV